MGGDCAFLAFSLLRVVIFSTLMRNSIPSVLNWDCRADGFGRCPLITIWVEIRPMSEKSRKKCQSFFHLFYFAWYG